MSGDPGARYPDERGVYCKKVGQTRVENAAEVLRSLGYDVVVGEPEDDDVDIQVYKGNELVLVIEVLNWKRNTYMDFRRVKSIKENFGSSEYNNSRKLLIFSFEENIQNQVKFFQDLDIDLLQIGFQTQPIQYYLFFRHQGRARDMVPNTTIAKMVERVKLVAYLRRVNLI